MTPRQVLAGLCDDTERLVKNSEVSERTRSKLLGLSADIKACVKTMGEGLSGREVCGQIEDLYWEVDKLRQNNPKLEKTYAPIIQRIDKALDYVKNMFGWIRNLKNGAFVFAEIFLDSDAQFFQQ